MKYDIKSLALVFGQYKVLREIATVNDDFLNIKKYLKLKSVGNIPAAQLGRACEGGNLFVDLFLQPKIP
jgi:uncharacterized protein with GYD domain